jgi:hypothetical protein
VHADAPPSVAVRPSRLLLAFVVACANKPSASTTNSAESPKRVASFAANPAVNGALEPEQIAPPPDGWWESERPCPAGTSLVDDEGIPIDRKNGEKVFMLPKVECRRADGTKHGPSTTFGRDWIRLLNGHYRNGFQHGVWESFYGARKPEDVDRYLYDEGVGIRTWRTVHMDTVTVKEHRGEGEIYITEHKNGRLVEEGLQLDGLRHGPWVLGDGAEQRTVEYDHGKASGSVTITGTPECDAFVERWQRCLRTKKGGERYEMAEQLVTLLAVWPLADHPVLAKKSTGPACLKQARNEKEFAKHACPP